MKKLMISITLFIFLFALVACGEQSERAKILEIYDQAVDNGFSGTYEEWLNTLKGEKGDTGENGKDGENGLSPMLQINSTTNMWEVSYDNGKTWASLNVEATGATGQDGNNGENGISPKLQINTSTDMWEISYDDGATWTSLEVNAKGIAGNNGITPKIRINNETNIWEISYDNGTAWISLEVKATGNDAIAPKLQINSETNEWEVSYDNGTTWVSLNVKATGAQGGTGANGLDGITPKLQINSETNLWEVSYDNGTTWISLGVNALATNGKDAVTYVPAIFCRNDGTKIYEFYYAYGSDIVYDGPSPDYQGVNGTAVTDYTFKYWDKSLKNITQPTVFTAQYSTNTYYGYKAVYLNYYNEVLYEHYYKDGATSSYPYVNQPFSYDDTNVYIFNGWIEKIDPDTNEHTYKVKPYIIERSKNGEYPQSLVHEEEIITELAKITETDANGYITYKGEKYYPFTGIAYTDGFGNAIAAGLQYYKVEPIQWRILLTQTDNLCLISEYVIDSQQFNISYKGTQSRTDYNGETAEVGCSNYKYSNIRNWLNTTFFNTAFTDNSLVLLTEVNNGVSSIYGIGTTTNDYVCENTFDKVFLPSLQLTWTKEWAVGSFDMNKGHITTGTDFAKASGWTNYKNNYATRSPYEKSATVYTIGPGGNTMVWANIDEKFGIRPAIYITNSGE